MRSNTCGGGPSIDSNATVAPLPPAIANEPLAGAAAGAAAERAGHDQQRRGDGARAASAARNRVATTSLIMPQRYR